MKLLILAKQDAAGTGYALKRAFDLEGQRYGWSARMIRRAETRWQYPSDMTWRLGGRKEAGRAQRLFDDADLIMVMQIPQLLRAFRGWARKPIIVCQIGTYFRDNRKAVARAVAKFGGIFVVNSLELQSLAPRAELLRWTVDTDMLAALRHRVPDGRIRIYHSPTDREIKSTAAFLQATDRLARRYPIDVEIVERVPWSENLTRKATADIVFDQVKLGYGLNSAEAWAMGIPSLVGLESPRARQAFLDHHGEFPYPDTTESTIEERLEELILDPAARERWGKVGREFVLANHSPKAVVPQAVALFERILA